MLQTIDITARIQKMAPLSPAAAEILGIMGRRNHELTELVTAIESDAVLTASVLRYVNSANLNLNRELSTVREAVSFLGDARTTSIALASAGKELFNTALEGYRGSRGDLGRHSLATAVAARELAAFSRGAVEPGIAYTAGLLHDLGKVVISDYLAECVDLILFHLDRQDVPDYLAGERRVLDTDHCQAGRELADHWSIPYVLIPAIAHHHAPMDAEPEHAALVYTVHLADALALSQGIGGGVDQGAYRLDLRFQEWIVADEHQLEKVLAAVRAENDRLGGLFATDTTTPAVL